MPNQSPRSGRSTRCFLSETLAISAKRSNQYLPAHPKQARKEAADQRPKVCQGCTISHLLFADDSLVFPRASVADWKRLKEIFNCYARASGQIFNFEKSSMFFSTRFQPASLQQSRAFLSTTWYPNMKNI